ncbi:MAG: flagellar hook-associated protein FlgL [Bdellovibrionota bacterium]
MTRITENMISSSLLRQMQTGQKQVERYGNEISTGLKVLQPGDSLSAGSIAEFQSQVTRLESYETRVKVATGQLQFQDEVLRQANEVVIRAKELATQGANETLSAEKRLLIAEEVYQLRDHLASLGNSTYQGRYIFGGNEDDNAPFTPNATPYPAFNASIPSSEVNYEYTGATGATATRTVQVSDTTSITLNTPGDEIFINAIHALERLGRSLAGYTTEPALANPIVPAAPDTTQPNAAYTFPADYTVQTQDIKDAITLLDLAKQDDILPEQISVAGRLNRLNSVASVLEATKFASKNVLAKLQEADMDESISKFSQAQTALQASYTIAAQVQSLSILNYL